MTPTSNNGVKLEQFIFDCFPHSDVFACAEVGSFGTIRAAEISCFFYAAWRKFFAFCGPSEGALEKSPLVKAALKCLFTRVVLVTGGSLIFCRRLQVLREEEFGPVKNAPGAATDSPDTARNMLLALGRNYVEAAGELRRAIAGVVCRGFFGANMRPGLTAESR